MATSRKKKDSPPKTTPQKVSSEKKISKEFLQQEPKDKAETVVPRDQSTAILGCSHVDTEFMGMGRGGILRVICHDCNKVFLFQSIGSMPIHIAEVEMDIWRKSQNFRAKKNTDNPIPDLESPQDTKVFSFEEKRFNGKTLLETSQMFPNNHPLRQILSEARSLLLASQSSLMDVSAYAKDEYKKLAGACLEVNHKIDNFLRRVF